MGVSVAASGKTGVVMGGGACRVVGAAASAGGGPGACGGCSNSVCAAVPAGCANSDAAEGAGAGECVEVLVAVAVAATGAPAPGPPMACCDANSAAAAVTGTGMEVGIAGSAVVAVCCTAGAVVAVGPHTDFAVPVLGAALKNSPALTAPLSSSGLCAELAKSEAADGSSAMTLGRERLPRKMPDRSRARLISLRAVQRSFC